MHVFGAASHDFINRYICCVLYVFFLDNKFYLSVKQFYLRVQNKATLTLICTLAREINGMFHFYMCHM